MRTEVSRKNRKGWDRIGVTWRPEWRTGIDELYYGTVRRWTLRVGPIGFYRLFLRTDWPISEKFQ